MNNYISYNKQSINKKDIEFVSNSLKEKLITTGPYVKKFEFQIKKLVNSKHVIACSSGTSALHLALLSLNLKKNNIVLMPAINFISAYNMCKLLKLKIYLVDVDPSTGQMTQETPTSNIYRLACPFCLRKRTSNQQLMGLWKNESV